MTPHDTDARMLSLAARLAVRGHGFVEPNPCVGCVLVDGHGTIVGTGFHQRFGSAHAERNALAMAGDLARGATAYITLEPCAHHGQTPPCTDALLEAGITRVVIGSRDPNPTASGGIDVLQSHGIAVEVRDDIEAIRHLNAPFMHRMKTGRPWVIAKWAQTLDGAIATHTGDSKWISGTQSRRMVHRERGRVDAILTGIGTVLADDPRLDARDVRVRRRALRVVVDPNLTIPLDATLLATAHEIPVLIASAASLLDSEKAAKILDTGAHFYPLASEDRLKTLLEHLAANHTVSTVMVEAGSGLLCELFEEDMVNAAFIFTAPRLLGDTDAPRAARGRAPSHIHESRQLETVWSGQRGEDTAAIYHMR